MALFGVDRAERKDDPFLTWKVRIFAIGATLGLAGIFLEQNLLVWGAIGVLVLGFGLRFLSNRSKDEPEG